MPNGRQKFKREDHRWCDDLIEGVSLRGMSIVGDPDLLGIDQF